MKNETELRDRIKKLLESAEEAWLETGAILEFEEYTAQAIIDHFGLTIETHATDQSRNPHTRIISEWKRP